MAITHAVAYYAALLWYRIRAGAMLPGREVRYLKVSSIFLSTQTFHDTSVPVTSLRLVTSTKIVNTGLFFSRALLVLSGLLFEGRLKMFGKEILRRSGTKTVRCKGLYLYRLSIQKLSISLSQAINYLQVQ
jgi:hypothetical protein